MNLEKLKTFLDTKVLEYNRVGFIEDDPITVPHRFNKLQDIEIAGFFAATLAWGQRKTIIKNSLRLMEWMDYSPHDFMLNHKEQDRERFLGFVHRTFNDTDLLYFLEFFQWYYKSHSSLEDLFIPGSGEVPMESALIHFHNTFFSLPFAPERTKKHVATPLRKSACKRLNMYLRWMVRKDDAGVDFGVWKNISSADLICPLDTHVHRVAHGLGLIQRDKSDWQAAVELTRFLRQLDSEDPVKYDFALFSLGVLEKY